MGWGGHVDPEHDALIAAQKMATAVREYLAAETTRNRSHLLETLTVFAEAAERTHRPRSIPS